MQPRQTYPIGVPCWVDVTQPDHEAGREFYGELFGWEFVDATPPDAPGTYFVAQLDGQAVAAVSSPPEDTSRPRSKWNTYVRVKSADEAAEAVTRAGGSTVVEPFDIPGAGRMALFADAEGAVFSVWQAGGFQGAGTVNAPGSWNWSNLATRDFDAAQAFYFELFGWETSTIERGFAFWRLAGYADFLERTDPEIRERHKGGRAPAGFSDAVAAVAPAANGDVPEWSVTFSVDDADAIAARVKELGGKVLAEPFDAGPTRITAVEDPQGAVFTASRFYPERLAQRDAA
jgi:predicted enzyme related to lactoylglutathione lyase